MERLDDIPAVRRQLRQWRDAGERVALVPTMGNLHEGHLALVEAARAQCPRVVVSIFVNPLQFGPGEDFDRYPRTEEQDARRLEALGVDGLFLPEERVLYPRGRETVTRIHVPGVSEGLCGAARPGHFDGVATVVAKLFNIVGPDVAVFGRKDYQQLCVIRRMVADLDLPVEVVGVPTVREADGLAMSSRNAYLSPEQRRRAPALHRVLVESAERLRAGEPVASVEAAASAALAEAGLEPEYVAVRRAGDLARPAPGEARVILAAARLGRARLIDNLAVEND